ncbi:hypothetical protein NBRGN_070_00730 [Nocardia brasiliensis NBRC 14402]|uniref:hypothetical protein n=1 Tax=Nocardia brasiliensis TaxID=37326 RepID=UPI0003010CDA|nr:hypothetical protein [Nocardia brasiliensis]ASF11177.1 hypothetical protein CEQ30_31895 [Nocardia brasiliensis]GAJ84268.1 hypothetical protein NBRGN_070_00730 [Nocardia brasiliensis NBRC 14402]SUB10118.1 Uncharacterised protein [Nocardia brasiliensis]
MDRRLRLRRIAWLLAVAALAVAALAAVPAIWWSDRFYRFQHVPLWALPVCLLGLASLVRLAPKSGWQRGWARVVPAALLTLAILPLVPVTMLWAAFGSEDENPVVVAVSPDGRHEARTHDVDAMIDTLCGVELRERGGLFSRRIPVWTAPEGQRCPQRVSFTGSDTITIIDARGKEITAHFDARRLQVTELVSPPS